MVIPLPEEELILAEELMSMEEELIPMAKLVEEELLPTEVEEEYLVLTGDTEMVDEELVSIEVEEMVPTEVKEELTLVEEEGKLRPTEELMLMTLIQEVLPTDVEPQAYHCSHHLF